MDGRRGTLVSVLLAGGILVLYFGIQINADLPFDQKNHLWSLAAGSSFFVTGLLIHQSEKLYRRFERAVDRLAAWFGILSWQVLLLGMSPVFIVLGAIGAGYGARMHSPIFAAIAWLAGIALVFIGGYEWEAERPRLSRRTILFAAGIALFAFLLRGIGAGGFPIILTGDEGSAGIGARDFATGDWNNIFIAGWFSFPSFFSFIQSLFIRVFGATTEALRLPSAIAGAATVAAVYLCGKAMFGERAGRFSALALAALHFHIHFSRLGLNNIWDGLGYTLTLGALWYGWARDRRLAYLLGGLALGFSQYFYVTSRGLFAILVACMVIAFLFRRSRFYRSAPHFVLAFAVALAVVFPLARYYIHEPNQFLAPFARVSSVNGKTDESIGRISEQIAAGLQAYTVAHLRSWYKPETPILRPIFGALFYLGIIFLLFRNRDSRLVFLTFWLVLFGFIGGLSESPPAAQRYVAAAPAAALVVGFGLHKAAEMFEAIWLKHARVAAFLGYAVILIAMASDLNFYFRDYRAMDRRENLASNGAISQELANYLQDKPEGAQVVFMHSPRMGYYSIPSIQYLAPQATGIDPPPDWASFDRSRLTGERIIFVFLPEDQGEIETVRAEFPGGLLLFKNAWNGEILFWLYEYAPK